MVHLRLADPPEDVKQELKKLTEEYLNQFSDDDVVPENGIYEYQRAHGSPKVIARLDMVDKILEDAERRGARTG